VASHRPFSDVRDMSSPSARRTLLPTFSISVCTHVKATVAAQDTGETGGATAGPVGVGVVRSLTLMASISRMASAYSSLYLHDTRGRHSRRSLHTPCTFWIRVMFPADVRLCEQQAEAGPSSLRTWRWRPRVPPSV
jgi:hypothetical protein